MKILGLTGSIATGKSFVAEVFRKHQVPVFSSDREVAKILQEQKVIDLISKEKLLTKAIEKNSINKEYLSNIVFKDSNALAILEEILHPMVSNKRDEFIKKHENEKILLLEIPLLFEKKYQNLFYKIITTYCSDQTQIERALRRKNIDIDRLKFIMKQQIYSNIKARMTDYLVYTDISYQYTEKQLDQIFIKEGVK